MDLNLLKSELLIKNFDTLKIEDKLDLLRNLIGINLFITKKQIISKGEVYKKIKEIFGDSIIDDLKNNLINKKEFVKKYKMVYGKTFNLILKNIKNEQE